jgi:hypothetical protein
MIFRCQSCGELHPLLQVELWNEHRIGNLFCRKCYAEHGWTDSLVNVMAFGNIAD